VFRQRLGALFTLVMLAGVLTVMAVALSSFLVYRSYADDFRTPEDEINSQFVGPSIASDRNGQQLGEYIDENEGLRDPIPLSEISPCFIAANGGGILLRKPGRELPRPRPRGLGEPDPVWRWRFPRRQWR
jgi:hypothetical protein